VRDLLVPDALLAVTGTLRPDDFTNGWSLIARSIRPLAAARAELADHLLLRLDLRDPVNHANGHGLARQLLEHLSPYRREEGLPLRLHYLRPGAEGRMRLADGWRVEPSDALLKRLRRMLGDENVEVIYQRELQLRPALPDPAAPPRLVVVR